MDRDQTAGPPAPVRRSAEDWRRSGGRVRGQRRDAEGVVRGPRVFGEDAFELAEPAQRGRAGAGVRRGCGFRPAGGP